MLEKFIIVGIKVSCNSVLIGWRKRGGERAGGRRKSRRERKGGEG